jgi:hypothetical protein
MRSIIEQYVFYEWFVYMFELYVIENQLTLNHVALANLPQGLSV